MQVDVVDIKIINDDHRRENSSTHEEADEHQNHDPPEKECLPENNANEAPRGYGGLRNQMRHYFSQVNENCKDNIMINADANVYNSVDNRPIIRAKISQNSIPDRHILIEYVRDES